MAELEHTRALAWHNRQVLAERLGWPAGALEACERTELEHPAWRFNWNQTEQVYTAVHSVRRLSFRRAQAPTIETLVEQVIDLDVRAAAEFEEWGRRTSPGWSVLRSQ